MGLVCHVLVIMCWHVAELALAEPCVCCMCVWGPLFPSGQTVEPIDVCTQKAFTQRTQILAFPAAVRELALPGFSVPSSAQPPLETLPAEDCIL